MLTAAQKNFLRNKGVNYALAELLGNVRQRRYERESSAEVLRRYRNYQRTKNEYNAVIKKAINMGLNVKHQVMRLQRIPAHEAILFRGQGLNVNHSTLRNRIQALPRNVPKTVNMKEFVRRLNAYEAVKPNIRKSTEAYKDAVLNFIRVMAPFGFNTSRFNTDQLTKYANFLAKNLKYQKGKVIGRIIGNRATNPHTAVGRRTIMKMFLGN
jgi:hypothetical protein